MERVETVQPAEPGGIEPFSMPDGKKEGLIIVSPD